MRAIAFLAMWWIVALGYSATWTRTWRYTWLIIMALLGIFTLKNYRATWYPRRHVSEDTLVRVGPHESYGTCGTMASHSEVVIYDTQHDWSKIGFGSLMGWIPSRVIETEGQHEG
jgi:uncharacterized protein YraI